MIEIKINGKTVEAHENETVLEVARREGYDIPTICHHDSVKPVGACRMCIVEIGVAGRPKKLKSSCTYKVEPNLEVITDSERVNKNRAMVLDLLRARVSDDPMLEEMARKYGNTPKPKFKNLESDCVLCGLCTRVCDEVVGAKAITLNGRGTELEVGGPFLETPEKCIGCGACVYVCPTDCIKLEETAETRTIVKWGRKLPMRTCKVCGYPFMPNFQMLQFRKWADLPKDFFDICQDCRE